MPGPTHLAALPAQPSVQQLEQHYEQFTNTTYKIFGQLMVRAWSDPNYMAQLKANPAEEMRKAGIPLPAGYHINPDQFVIADKPTGVQVEALHRAGPITGAALATHVAMLKSISCAGSASSFSCPSCTASCAGSGGC